MAEVLKSSYSFNKIGIPLIATQLTRLKHLFVDSNIQSWFFFIEYLLFRILHIRKYKSCICYSHCLHLIVQNLLQQAFISKCHGRRHLLPISSTKERTFFYMVVEWVIGQAIFATRNSWRLKWGEKNPIIYRNPQR